MGRHQIHVSPLATGYRGGPKWSDPYHCEWAVVVGDRIRRLRNARKLTLHDVTRLVYKPNQGFYSGGYFSRLERGWATAPLYVYIAIADVFDLQPGRLLGPDDAQREVTEAEVTLVKLVRRLGIDPEEAIARVAGIRDEAPPGRSGEVLAPARPGEVHP